MPFQNYLADDTLPEARAKLNLDSAAGNALETGLTAAQAATTSLTGRVTTLEGAPAGADVSLLLTGSDASRTARDLGADLDPDTITTSLIGTSFITSGAAVAAKWPAGEGLYTIQTTRSGAGGSTAGRLLTQTVYAFAKTWQRSELDGIAWTPWREVGALGAQSYERIIFNVSEWGAESGGDYTISIPASTHGLSRRVHIAYVVRTVGGVNEPVDPSLGRITEATGDVTLSVTATPDNRFVGRIVLRGF